MLIASKKDHIKVVKILLASGANINEKGWVSTLYDMITIRFVVWFDYLLFRMDGLL